MLATIEHTLNELSHFIGHLNPVDFSKPLSVLNNSIIGQHTRLEESIVQVETNFFRELVFNLDHCIHHNALIRIGVNDISDVIMKLFQEENFKSTFLFYNLENIEPFQVIYLDRENALQCIWDGNQKHLFEIDLSTQSKYVHRQSWDDQRHQHILEHVAHT